MLVLVIGDFEKHCQKKHVSWLNYLRLLAWKSIKSPTKTACLMVKNCKALVYILWGCSLQDMIENWLFENSEKQIFVLELGVSILLSKIATPYSKIGVVKLLHPMQKFREISNRFFLENYVVNVTIEWFKTHSITYW